MSGGIGKLKLNLHKEQRNATSDLKQKAKVKCAAEGDENNKYFHTIARGRRRKNTLKGLLINGVWTEDPPLIKREVFNYFKDIMKSQSPTNHNLKVRTSKS